MSFDNFFVKRVIRLMKHFGYNIAYRLSSFDEYFLALLFIVISSALLIEQKF